MKKLLFVFMFMWLYVISFAMMQVVVTDSKQKTIYDRTFNLLENETGHISKDISAALKLMPETGIIKRSFSEVQLEIVFSGGTFEQTGIMLDNINIKDPQTGHYGFDLTVPVPMLESISIVKSGSAVKGSGALAGLVDIKTRNASDYIEFKTSYGSFSTFYNYLGASRVINGFGISAGIENATSAGYREGTDYYKNTAYFKAEPVKGQSVIISWSEKDIGAYDYYTPGRGFASREFIIGRLILVNSEILPGLTASPYYRSHYDRFTLDNTRPSFYVNRHNTEMYGSDISYKTLLGGKNEISVLYGFHREGIQSRSLGNRYSEKSKISLGCFSEMIDDAKINISVSAEKKHEKPTVELMPSAAFSYGIFEALELRGAYSYSARYPVFTELYYNDSVSEGNPDLKPERANDIKAGINLDVGAVRLSIDKTYRFGEDVIDWGDFGKRNSSNKVVWQIKNIARINTSGFSVDMGFPAFIADMQVSYAYLDSYRSEGYVSKYGLNYIRHKLSGAAAIDLNWAVFKTECVYRDFTDRTRDYLGLDVSVSGKITDNIRLTVKVDNLLNRYFEEVQGVPAYGRYIEAGAAVNF